MSLRVLKLTDLGFLSQKKKKFCEIFYASTRIDEKKKKYI